MFNNANKSYLFDTIWLFVFIAVFFGVMLGARALSVPDEARYTEIPREMLLSHNFITPHLDGVKYFEKPPFLYWVQAGMINLFGLNEWALRLPTAFFALLTCLASYTVGRVFFNRTVGIFSALILATCPLFFAMAHSITLDMTVSLWLTITLFCFIVAVDLPWRSAARRYVCWGMYVAAALAVLTKGLIGIALPGLIVLTWFLIFNRWKELLQLHLTPGLLIFLAIVLPWHILVQIKNPEFFHFYFVEQHFTRFLTKAMHRYQPVWWFIPILIIGMFPWIFFLPKALWQAVKVKWQDRFQHHREIFFVLWAVEIFIFFSLSDSKLIPYILPVFPPLAILIAVLLVKNMKENKNATTTMAILSGVSILLGIGLWSTPYWPYTFSAAQLFHLHLMSVPVFILAIVPWFFVDIQKRFMAIFFTQIFIMISFLAAVPSFDLRPIKSLALTLNSMAKPNDIIASYGLYYQDLPVYTQHLVLIVNWTNELTFGFNHQADAKKYMIDDQQFWKIWREPHRVFAIMDESDYEHAKTKYKIFVIAKHDDDYLVSNKITRTESAKQKPPLPLAGEGRGEGNNF